VPCLFFCVSDSIRTLLTVTAEAVIDGTKARLFVHGAEPPCLIVNDMKLGDSEGAVALWVGPGTEGYFTNLKITQ
jgi:hypothetical protein